MKEEHTMSIEHDVLRLVVLYFILGIIVSLRESYWDLWAPILDAAFFWVTVLLWPVLLVCPTVRMRKKEG